jgi:hypothetical protein
MHGDEMVLYRIVQVAVDARAFLMGGILLSRFALLMCVFQSLTSFIIHRHAAGKSKTTASFGNRQPFVGKKPCRETRGTASSIRSVILKSILANCDSNCGEP